MRFTTTHGGVQRDAGVPLQLIEQVTLQGAKKKLSTEVQSPLLMGQGRVGMLKKKLAIGGWHRNDS